MKYFIDTEFIEDFTRPWIGKARHYIDLISIAILAEDGREYYAVSNEFDFDHVWSKFQWKGSNSPIQGNSTITKEKEYWLRDNVLMPIVHDLAKRDYDENGWYFADFGSASSWLTFIKQSPSWERTWKPRAKELIKKFGKHNRRIAEEIAYFAGKGLGKPEFYGYYADYDWVLFCSLYGRMLDLPNEFPMYCRDLKQILDEKNDGLRKRHPIGDLEQCDFHSFTVDDGGGFKDRYHRYQEHHNYPKQTNAHNALDDARWNKKLYDFLQTV